MKKLAFLVASALMAGAAYCTNVGERLFSSESKSETGIVKQQKDNSLILEKSEASSGLLAAHSSHTSHTSHSSHRSHYSSR